jgi:adenylate cyclase
MENPHETDAALAKILASSAFRESPRLSQLLEYLVRQVQQGNAELIKGYAIGVDVFGKADSFDPSSDSLVRVQMARLRDLLDQYYAKQGATDPIRIILEKGQYTPRFEIAPHNTQTLDAMNWIRDRSRVVIGFAVTLLLTGGLLWWFTAPRPQTPEVIAARPIDGPMIFVDTYAINGSSDMALGLRDGLRQDLITYLSQLPNLGVFGHDTTVNNMGDDRQPGAAFRLSGSISVADDKFRVNSSLYRLKDGAIIWSSATEPNKINPSNVFEAQSRIALSVASALGLPYGVIHENMRNELANHAGLGMEDYLCELGAYEYMRAKSPEQITEVQTCLEAIVKARPLHSNAWALLAWIYGDAARLPRNASVDEPAMQRSLDAARKAVKANSTNAIAFQQLAIAQFFSGQTDAALASLDTALRLSPNNSEILANASWMLAIAETNPNAMALGEKALELNPGHPAWYWLGPTIVALQSGEKTAALQFAKRNAEDRSPISMFLLAAAYTVNGSDNLARNILTDLHEEFPTAAENHEAMFDLYQLNGTLRDLLQETSKLDHKYKG